ncbi:MAG: ClpX C4-type zinc finger protein [Armatimonadetes bacterium]|nr:ClpX C4-type zinc finger protein [Armatimonadota bacterium]
MSRSLALQVEDEAYQALEEQARERGVAVAAIGEEWLAAASRRAQAAAAGQCSFCGKGRDQVRQMVTGRDARICAECIAECQRLLQRSQDRG